MTYQNQSNVYVAFKAQASKGTPASGAGGFVLRVAGGDGGEFSKNVSGSNEVRRDGMRTRGRHGLQRSAGRYLCELSLGNSDAFFQALLRGTIENALSKSAGGGRSLRHRVACRR